MSLRYISVCSGIEAASVAWHPLGFQPVAFSEIEKFPSALLAHHYPSVPNRGDMTKFNQWPHDSIDLLVGGTPCQAFSVAGLRKGLDDPRGNLTLTFLSLARRYGPRWVVWENVPGVLSDRTNAFGQFLGGLAELGYGCAYRVLDAQYFGVAQRRRRVFVVGYLGDWRRAAAVLFEQSSLRGDSAPSRQAGQRTAPTLDVRAGRSGETSFHTSGGLVPETTGTLGARASSGGGFSTDFETSGGLVPEVAGCLDKGTPGRSGGQANYIDHLISESRNASGLDVNCTGTLTAGFGKLGAPEVDAYTCIPSKHQWPAEIASTLNAAFGSKQGLEDQHALNGAPLFVPVFASSGQSNAAFAVDKALALNCMDGQPCIAHSLKGEGHDASEDGTGRGTPLVPVAFNWQMGAQHTGMTMAHDYSPALIKNQTYAVHQPATAVRRLTPRECERLQGFPDDYTLVPYRGKPAADGPRYKALGNSMAVPVMHWIGRRLAMVDKI